MSVIEHFWYRVRPAHLALYPLSVLFGAALGVRRTLYARGVLRSQQMPVPVIVVGNLTVGGSGKTPLTLWLAQRLRAAGHRPGIVTRGYRGSERLQEVHPHSAPAQAGDEAVLLARRAGCPVFAGRDRVAAARALLRAHSACDVLLSDDGLQHYRLARAFEIAVIDGARGFGNGLLLPAGPLREPRSRLREVDAIVVNTGLVNTGLVNTGLVNTGVVHAGVVNAGVVNAGQVNAGVANGGAFNAGVANAAGTEPSVISAGVDLTGLPVPSYAMRLEGERLVNLKHPARAVPLSDFAGRSVHALAGIGHPRRFFAQLEGAGLSVAPHPFPDHFAFAPDDLAFAGDAPLLMTEKDAVKCAAFARESWWYLPVTAQVDPALAALLLDKLEPPHGAPHGPETA